MDAKLPDKIIPIILFFSVFDLVTRPQSPPSQCPFEVADCCASNSIYHLLVELRIGLRRGKAILGEQTAVIQVHRGVKNLAGRVVIDYGKVFIGGTQIQLAFFPGKLDSDFIDVTRIDAPAENRIEGKGAKPPVRRTGYIYTTV